LGVVRWAEGLRGARSVILLLSHTSSGSVGLVLNKHSKLDLDPGEQMPCS
jgi:putative AlgH/UPF0301 family transcriptional regulator